MKFLVLLQLFAALLVSGCGEKSSSEGSDSVGESAEPPADTAKQSPAGPPVADSPSESATPPSDAVKPSADSPKPLISDADVERLLKEAVEEESLERGSLEPGEPVLAYLKDHDEPYSGWAKLHMPEYGNQLTRYKDGKLDGPRVVWHANGQKVQELTNKDGKLDGLMIEWHENGQKAVEATFKDEELDGLFLRWHENGQKAEETTWKDGKPVSKKYWNSKGKEVETEEEARK